MLSILQPVQPGSLINQTWVATGSLNYPPGTNLSYSSTNFVLLGLLAAKLRGAASWDEFEQASIFDRLPAERKALYSNLTFATHSPPSKWTDVHGLDRTSYNGANASARPGKDVWHVAGVYAGWTASDLTASVADVARFGYDLHGAKGPRILSKSSQKLMVPVSPFYGFATMNLSFAGISGQSTTGPYAKVYGHLGAVSWRTIQTSLVCPVERAFLLSTVSCRAQTYGYDSLIAYYPGLDVAISVASDIETDNQAQPSDTMCLAYNAILAAFTGTPEPSCRYIKGSYYGGKCECVPALQSASASSNADSK